MTRVLRVEKCSECPFFVWGDVTIETIQGRKVETRAEYCNQVSRFLNNQDRDTRYIAGMPDWCPLEPAP